MRRREERSTTRRGQTTLGNVRETNKYNKCKCDERWKALENKSKSEKE